MPTISRLMQGVRLPTVFGARRAPYLKTLERHDFFGADVGVKAGKWELLGEYVTLAQQEIRVGYGTPEYQKNQATVLIDIRDNSVDKKELEGVVRVQIADANDVVKPNGVVLEEIAANLRQNPDDRTKQIPLPEYMECTSRKDDKIQIWFKSTTDTTVGLATVIRLPVSIYRLPSA